MKDFKKSMPKLIGLMLGIAVLLGIIGLSATADNVSADESNVSSDINSTMSVETNETENFSAVSQGGAVPPSTNSLSSVDSVNGSETSEGSTSGETSSEVSSEAVPQADALADSGTAMTKAEFLESLTTYNFAVESLTAVGETVYSGQSARGSITFSLTATESKNSVVPAGEIVGRIEMPKYSVYNTEISSSFFIGKDYAELKQKYEAKVGGAAPFAASNAAFQGLDANKNYVFFVNWSSFSAGNMAEGGFTLTPAPNGVSGTDLTSEFKSSFYYGGEEVTAAETAAIANKYSGRSYTFKADFVSTAQQIKSSFVSSMNRNSIVTDMNSNYKYADFTMAFTATPSTANSYGRLYDGEYTVEQLVTIPKDARNNLMILLKQGDLSYTASVAGTTGEIKDVVTEKVNGTDYVSSFKVILNQKNTSNPKAQISQLSGYFTFKNIEVNMATYSSDKAWSAAIQIGTAASGYKSTTKSIDPNQGTKLADVTDTTSTGSNQKITFTVTPPANEGASANLNTYLQSVENSPVALKAYAGTYPIFYTNGFENKQNRPLETLSFTYTWDKGFTPKSFSSPGLSWAGGSAVTYEVIATMSDGSTKSLQASAITAANATSTPIYSAILANVIGSSDVSDIKSITVTYKNVPIGAKTSTASVMKYNIVSASQESTILNQSVKLDYQYKASDTSTTTVGGTATSSAVVTYDGKDAADPGSDLNGKDKGINKSAYNESGNTLGASSEGDIIRYTLTIKNSDGVNWSDLDIYDSYSEYLEAIPAVSGGFIGGATLNAGGNTGLSITAVTNDPSTNKYTINMTGVVKPNTTITIVYRMRVAKDPNGKAVNNQFAVYAYVGNGGTGGGTGSGGTGSGGTGGGKHKVSDGFWSGSSTASTAVEQKIKIGYSLFDFKAKDGVTASSESTLADGHTFKVSTTISGNRVSNLNLTVGAFSQWAASGYDVQSISYQTSSMSSPVTLSTWDTVIRNTASLSGNLVSVQLPTDFKISSSTDSITFTYSYKVDSSKYPWASVGGSANGSSPITALAYFKENSTIVAAAASSGYTLTGPINNLSTNAPVYYVDYLNGGNKLAKLAGASKNVIILRTGAKGNITASSSPANTKASPQGMVSGVITSSGTEALKFNSFAMKLPESMTYTTGSVTVSGVQVINSDGTIATLQASDLSITVKDRVKDVNTGLYTSGQILIITDSQNRVMQIPGINGSANGQATIKVQTAIDQDYINFLVFYDETKIGVTEKGLVAIYLQDDNAILDPNTGNGQLTTDGNDLNGNSNTAEKIIVSNSVNLQRVATTTLPTLDITSNTITGSSISTEAWAPITSGSATTILPGALVGWDVKVGARSGYDALANPTIVIKVPSSLDVKTDATGFKGGVIPSELSTPQINTTVGDGYTYITYTINKTIPANSSYTISFRSTVNSDYYGVTSLEAYLLPTASNPFLHKEAEKKAGTEATPLWANPSSVVGWATDSTVTTGGQTVSTSVNPTNNLTHMLYTRKLVEVYGFTGASTNLAESVGFKSADSSTGESLLTVSDKDAVVRYAITAKNNGDRTFNDLMVIDRLPMANDRYIVASNAKRGSNTGVSLYNNGNFIVYTESSSGTNKKILNAGTDYIIEFAEVSEMDSFPAADWDIAQKGSGRWTTTLTSNTTAFRVALVNGSLASNTNLVISFDTQWDTDTIQAGDTIYNSFGFAATSTKGTGYKVPFKIEPLKQGVQLISNGKIIINKTLLDSRENPNKDFDFNIGIRYNLTRSNQFIEDVGVTVSKVNDPTGYTYAGQTIVDDLYLPDSVDENSVTIEETTTGYDTTINLDKYEEVNGVKTWTFGVLNKASYSVKYDGNGSDGGVVPTDSATYAHGTSATVLTGAPSRTGTNFLGWTLTKDGSGTVLTEGNTVAMNGNVTLYAKWEFNDYNVVYNENVAPSLVVGTVNPTVAYHYGDTVTVEAPSFTVKGKIFKHWSTDSVETSSSQAYTAGQTFVIQAGNVTLYAQYEEVLYTVTYDKNDSAATGIAPVDSGKYVYGYNVPIAGKGDLLKSLHFFDGWNTKSDGSGTAYPANSVMSAPGITENTTLYAQWKTNPLKNYTTTYLGNGGTFTDGSSQKANTMTEGTAFNLLSGSDLPTRANYTFIGWSTLPSAYTLYPAGASFTVSSDMTFYAIWQSKIKITVVYHLAGNVKETTTDIVDYPQNGTAYTIRTGQYTLNNGTTVTGWNTGSSGAGTAYKFGQVIVLNETADKTIEFYPVAEEVSRKVTFSNYSSYVNDYDYYIPSTNFVVGKLVDLPPITKDMVISGKTFVGWSYVDPITKLTITVSYHGDGTFDPMIMPDATVKFKGVWK